MTTTILDHALFYASLGWGVFPLQPRNKLPAIPAAHEKGNLCKGECGKEGHGFYDAVKDPEHIRHWWTNGYSNCNVGIATGARSGILVIDIDAGHGGEESLAALLSLHEPLPITPIAHTGGGGRHIVFKYPGIEIRNSAGKLGTGIDCRGDGGYVVAANSIHPSGKLYKWDSDYAPSKTPLAMPPQWLIDMLIVTQVAPIRATQADGSAYPPGTRHEAFLSLAGSMQRRGMSENAITDALIAESKRWNPPPSELDLKNIRLIAQSVGRYTPGASLATASLARSHVEWAFCKTIFMFDFNIPDFIGIQPSMFQDAKLSAFWKNVQSSQTVAVAGGNAGILSELGMFENYQSDIVDEYARQIIHYAYLDKVNQYAAALQQAARAGDGGKIESVISGINRDITNPAIKRGQHVSDSFDEVEQEIIDRTKNPTDVWGIPYAWPYLSKLTGGKQSGELILLAGEPKVGKSWWATQDALETAISGIPVLIWSGEMKRKQITRRLLYLLGVDQRRSKSGMWESDWPILAQAKEIIYNAPIFLDDRPLQLSDLKPLLKQKKDECGIRQFVIDYAYLVHAPGKDEIERTGNVSIELKNICSELDLAGVLITSVSKMGMDTASETVAKSSIRGSGQQIHDADVVYMLTKFAPVKNDPDDLRILPARHENIVSLHIKAGRELDHSLPGGVIHYERINNSPKFKELKVVQNTQTPPPVSDWTDK